MEPNIKRNTKYYSNEKLKSMIPEIDRLSKLNESLFIQDRTRAPIANSSSNSSFKFWKTRKNPINIYI